MRLLNQPLAFRMDSAFSGHTTEGGNPRFRRIPSPSLSDRLQMNHVSYSLLAQTMAIGTGAFSASALRARLDANSTGQSSSASTRTKMAAGFSSIAYSTNFSNFPTRLSLPLATWDFPVPMSYRSNRSCRILRIRAGSARSSPIPSTMAMMPRSLIAPPPPGSALPCCGARQRKTVFSERLSSGSRKRAPPMRFRPPS